MLNATSMNVVVVHLILLALVPKVCCEMPWYRETGPTLSALFSGSGPDVDASDDVSCYTKGSCDAVSEKSDSRLLDVKQFNSPGSAAVASTCGTVRTVQHRIVGGKEAGKGQFPWLAQLSVKHGGRFRLACGGTLVSAQVVLTAAHCIKTLEVDNYQVLLGKHRSDISEPCTEQKFQVEKIQVHPGYSRKTLHNDIAMVWIVSTYGQPAHFTDYIQPACLPHSANDGMSECSFVFVFEKLGPLRKLAYKKKL